MDLGTLLKVKNIVFNSDGNHLVEVQVLGQTPEGYANGQIAHNYYSRLYPEKYKALQKQWEKEGVEAIDKGATYNTYDKPLPITAEELYQTLRAHPRIYDHLVALDNFNGTKNPKHLFRHTSMLFNPNLYNRLQHANMRAVTDNWEFLKLSPEDIRAARQDFALPKWMSDAQVESYVNQKLITDYMGVRSVYNRRTALWDKTLEDNALSSVIAPYNGQWSGIGGNQLKYTSKGGVGGDVTAILNNRGTNIHSYKDYREQLARDFHKQDTGKDTYKKFDEINQAAARGDISVEEGVKQTEDLAKQLGIRGYHGNSYRHGDYFGALQRPTIGLKAYTSNMNSQYNNILEVGGVPTFSFVNTPFSSTTKTFKQFMEEVPLHKGYRDQARQHTRTEDWYKETIPKTKEYRTYTSEEYKKAVQEAQQRADDAFNIYERWPSLSTWKLTNPIKKIQNRVNNLNDIYRVGGVSYYAGVPIVEATKVSNSTDSDLREYNKE